MIWLPAEGDKGNSDAVLPTCFISRGILTRKKDRVLQLKVNGHMHSKGFKRRLD